MFRLSNGDACGVVVSTLNVEVLLLRRTGDVLGGVFLVDRHMVMLSPVVSLSKALGPESLEKKVRTSCCIHECGHMKEVEHEGLHLKPSWLVSIIEHTDKS